MEFAIIFVVVMAGLYCFIAIARIKNEEIRKDIAEIRTRGMSSEDAYKAYRSGAITRYEWSVVMHRELYKEKEES